ncbi:peptidoglycan DD-metalloendopeptidase family protein [uncultured Flavobacterium sp.]|uniref:murein hydrolase activator EnvC family protein n=1 Tax=uncultured Flavobacterium sp. TaxID=165435 RepID=UPI0025F6A920|nr:peptidoglycan DD-metalloendopeptidase family protein [uncultured Flavobacterium sp.]
MIRAIFTILLIGFTTLGMAQTDEKKQLEQKKAKIIKEIQGFRSLLKKKSNKEKSVLTKIADNTTKIRLSEKLISNTQKQTRILDDEIYANQKEINKLNRELKVLKDDYANMIVEAYKSRSQQSRIMFILSSQNFLQAYKRMQYMKQYANFRKLQAESIKGKMVALEELAAKLNEQKKEKEKLLAENLKAKEALVEEKKRQEKLVKLIQKDKRKYTADIKKKQRETRKIDKKIDKIIRDAIAEANRKAAEKARKEAGTTTTASTKKPTKKKGSTSTAAPSKIVLTKEGKIVSDNFKANRGKLPWPVEKGYMSLGYGKQRHPVLKTIEIDHSWIEITTEENANARSIFDGKVLDVQIISGTKSVLVIHGDYITVYSNLVGVKVKAGDIVTRKQTLGKVYTNAVTGKTIIKLMILKNTTRLNPEKWITPL